MTTSRVTEDREADEYRRLEYRFREAGGEFTALKLEVGRLRDKLVRIPKGDSFRPARERALRRKEQHIGELEGEVAGIVKRVEELRAGRPEFPPLHRDTSVREQHVVPILSGKRLELGRMKALLVYQRSRPAVTAARARRVLELEGEVAYYEGLIRSLDALAEDDEQVGGSE